MKFSDEYGLIVALDPGKRTGIATRNMQDDHRELRLVSAMPFWDICSVLSNLESHCSLEALVVEDTRRQPIYQERRGRLKGQALAKMARSVGGIDRDVTLWEDWAGLHGVPVIMWPPFRGKWKATDFDAAVSSDHSRTNQHGRDAARLALAVSPGDLRVARAAMTQ